MSRYEELQRQRALIAEHLAWLDSELTRLHGGPAVDKRGLSSAPFPPPPQATTPQPVPTAAAEPPAVLKAEIDQALTKYQQESANSPAAARRGCFALFAITLGILVLGILGVYFLKYYR